MSDIRLSELLGPAWHPVARDVFDHGHTHYNFSGGRGSLKSSTVSLLVPLLLALHPQAHALVLRKVGRRCGTVSTVNTCGQLENYACLTCGRRRLRRWS